MDNRNRHLKRLLAFVLSAAMVITYMPPFMPAYAEAGSDMDRNNSVAEDIIEDKTPEAPDAADDDTSSEAEQAAAGEGTADAAGLQAKDEPAKPESAGASSADADKADQGRQSSGDTAEETAKPVTLRANSSNYAVTVSCDAASGIPEGASLEVSELSGGQYDRYLEKTADALDTEADSMSYVKLLDISIVHDGKKIQPDKEVKVSIQLKDTDLDSSREDVSIVHFGKKTEVLDAAVNSGKNKVTFDTDGFSIYAITSQPATDLDGKTVAIVHVNTKPADYTNKSRYVGRALQSTARGTTQLKAQSVAVETHTSEKDLVTADPDSTITEWTFKAAGDANTYYISTGEGESKKYLNISSGRLVLSDDQQALTVSEGTGSHSGTVRINGGNNIWLLSSVAVDGNNGNDPYFQAGAFEDKYGWMTLCEIDKVEIGDVVYTGQKISVQDLVDGNEVLIYQTLYNSATEKYEDYVIDYNGNLVKAYDNGDTLTLYGDEDAAPIWMLSECLNSSGQPSGYYVFKNVKTGLVLHPLADGTLVAPYVSDDVDGVSLKGRASGGYTSTIEFWDESAHNFYGYHISGEAGTYKLSTATGSGSQAFSFAKRIPRTVGELHEVDTVDSKANGVTIRMFNYPNRDYISNITGSNNYQEGVLPPPHASMTLADDGYPAFKNGTSSGSGLFSPNNSYYQGEGNHLFLSDTYNATGYYEYNAFHNFAHYNKNTGNFTVYAETGTPYPTASNPQFFYRRGNFMPYDELDTTDSTKRAQNLYNGDGVLLDYQDPTYGDTLYGLKSRDYFFGMTMEFEFMMPKDGIDKGNPLVYEFNGDDDLWIYIDDVLVLDIGGVHDAWSGIINFATGEIDGRGAGGAKTIKDCFKNAGVFPDGTAWDDSKVDEYFSGNTFVDYGSHSFNMFYMEHGEGASNLETRFNLPVIEKGKVTVEKQLSNTSQVDYANVLFAYQAFKKNGQGHYEPMTEAVYEGKTDDEGNPVPVNFFNNVTIDGKNYDNVFYLKPREAAVFSEMPEEQEYYVQEIGIKNDYYDEIFVNDVKIDGETAEAQEGIYRSPENTVRNRVRVTFTNHCDKRNTNELIIKKRLAGGSPYNGDVFEFRVMLENAAGELVPYYQGGYYIRDDNGVYYKYDENNKLIPNGHTPYQMTSGNYGTINKIPPGYNVVIMDLLTGTDFYVDEIRVNDSSTLLKDSQWKLVSTTVSGNGPSEISDASIYDYETGQTVTKPSLGSIEHGKDGKDASASVVFTNEMKTGSLKITKKLAEDSDQVTIPAGTKFTVKGPAGYGEDGTKEIAFSDFKETDDGYTYTENNIPTGAYTVAESNADIDGYILETTYDPAEAVEEGAVPQKAAVTVEENKTASATVVNKYTSDRININVKKNWDDDDDNDGKRPDSLVIQLFIEGAETAADVIDTVTLNEAGGWSASFTGLRKYSGGELIVYVLKEVLTDEVREAYTAAAERVVAHEEVIEGEKTGDLAGEFTNSHTPEEIRITVTKKWDDADDQDGKRAGAGAKVKLYRTVDGQKTEVEDSEKTVGTENNWSDSWDELPAYDDGKKIAYSVEESLAENSGYESSVGAVTPETDPETGEETGNYTVEVTNSHTPEEIRITVTKKWDDADDQDGKRAGAQAKVKLYRTVDGQKTEVEDSEKTVGTENNWSDSWDELPAYDDGKKIAYSVEESLAENSGYESSVGAVTPETDPETGEETGNYTVEVTNTHTPEEIRITVTKKWDDADDQDGKRAGAGAKVKLYRTVDGQKTEVEDSEKTVGTENNWSDSWDELPAYDDGKKIAYSVEESLAENSGYESSVGAVTPETDPETGEETGNYTVEVTNKHVTEKIDVVAEKKWEDNDDASGSRPESITISLYRKAPSQDEVAEKTLVGSVTLDGTADEDGEFEAWKGIFPDLPKYEGGEEIEYTVEEDPVDGYEAEITGPVVTEYEDPGEDNKVARYTFTVTNTPETVDLEITKDLLDYVDHNSSVSGNVTTTFVFRVTGTRKGAAKPEYSTQVGIQLDSAGTKSKTLKNLPKGLTYTVEEVYSGSSSTVKPSGPKTLTDEDLTEEGGRYIYKVKFENSGRNIEYGGGVINKYDGENPMKQEGKTHSGSGQN